MRRILSERTSTASAGFEMRARKRILSLAAGIALAGTVTSCLGTDAEATVKAECVPFDPADTEDAFPRVAEVLERRCGTLDCHGAASRPLRLYGNSGLRRPEPDIATEDCQSDGECGGAFRHCVVGLGCVAEEIKDQEQYAQYFPDGAVATTKSELIDNWRTVCGLEPELTTLVHRGELDPLALTIVRKARLREKHKGGLIWNEGDLGDECLVDWLTGVYDKGDGPRVVPQVCIDELEKL